MTTFRFYRAAAPVCMACGLTFQAVLHPEDEHPHDHHKGHPRSELAAVHDTVVTSTAYVVLTRIGRDIET